MDVYRKYALSRDDIYLFLKGEAQKAYLTFGCHYVAELSAHRFVVWAPNARAVSVVGDFNCWNDAKDPMERIDGGIFVAAVKGLKNGDIYKFAIFGANGERMLKADPFAFHAEVRPKTGSKVWDIQNFGWHDSEFLAERAKSNVFSEPMSIYEMQLGSFITKEGSNFPSVYELAEKTASYVKEMGYTHVELLPITEFPLDMSWGYQVTGYFAPTSRYGTPEDYMHFVDVMHMHGIKVIMDWVPAHFPKDAHGLARFDGTCLFEHENPLRGEHPQWGTLIFNHSRNEVISFLISSAMYFADVYHVDGIRVDAVTSMLYLDYARDNGNFIRNREGGNIDLDAVEFLKKLNSVLLTVHAGFITVAEESTAYPMVTKPPKDGGLGFTFKWNMGFMHDTLKYMSIDPVYRKYEHNKLTFSMMYAFNENFILPYSHDEVVHGKASMVGKMHGDYWQKFASLRVLYSYMFAHPGKKLMFMGSEFAQFIEWDEKKQLDWFLADYPSHKGIKEYVKELNRIYTSHPALYEQDTDWSGFLWSKVNDSDSSALAFIRRGTDENILCVFNFTPVVRYGYRVGLPHNGRLELLLNSDSVVYGGSGVQTPDVTYAVNEETDGFEYAADITLPPLAAQYFVFIKEDLPEQSVSDK